MGEEQLSNSLEGIWDAAYRAGTEDAQTAYAYNGGLTQPAGKKPFKGSLTTAQERWDLAPWQPIETAPKDARILLKYKEPSIGILPGGWCSEEFKRNPKPYWSHVLTPTYGVKEAREIPPIAWLPLPKETDNV